mgnify:CR=1 FL=1
MEILFSMLCMMGIGFVLYHTAKRTVCAVPLTTEEAIPYHWGKTALFCTALRVLFLAAAFLASRIFFENATLWSVFERWDASHYLRIATEGYGKYQEGGHYLTLVFLPLYPWVCKLFLLLFHNVQAVFVIISNLFFIAGATFYHATVSKKYGAACADTMLLLLMLSPFSFFFGAMMPESTFLFCWAAALYFARKKWWVLACFFGALGALTRLLGVLIVVMIFIEMLQNDKPFFAGGKKQVVKKLLKYGLLAMVPLGTVVYLLVNFMVAGDAFAFLYYEKLNWFQKFTPIWESLYRVAQNVAEPSGLLYTVWLPELIAIVLIIALLVIFARSYALSELWYVLIYAVMTYSTSWLLSGARYLLVCFPAFTMVALLLQRHQKAKTLVLVGCGFLQMIYFVGYLQGKPIM